MPTCSPLGPTSRTSGTRIRSLMRGSALMGSPRVVLGRSPLRSPTWIEAPRTRTRPRSRRCTAREGDAPSAPPVGGATTWTRRPGGRGGWERELRLC